MYIISFIVCCAVLAPAWKETSPGVDTGAAIPAEFIEQAGQDT